MSQMMGTRVPTKALTITFASATTGDIDLAGFTLAGVWVPSGVGATTLTFQVAPKIGATGGVTNANTGVVAPFVPTLGAYMPVYDSTGTLVSIPVQGPRFFAINPDLMRGCEFVRLVFGAAITGTVYCAGVITGGRNA